MRAGMSWKLLLVFEGLMTDYAASGQGLGNVYSGKESFRPGGYLPKIDHET